MSQDARGVCPRGLTKLSNATQTQNTNPAQQLGSAAAALIVILLWVYYSSISILLFGAEFTVGLANRPALPESDAANVVREHCLPLKTWRIQRRTGTPAFLYPTTLPSERVYHYDFTDVQVSQIEGWLRFRLQQADLAGGKLRGLLTWSSMAELANGLPSQAALNFEQFELGSLDLVHLSTALRGMADGQLRLDIAPRQPARDWSGEVRLRIRDFTVGENPLGNAYLPFSKAANTPQIEFSVRDGRQTFAMQGTCGLQDVDDASQLGTQQLEHHLE